MRKVDLKNVIKFCKEYDKVKRLRAVRKTFMTTIELFFEDNGYLSIDLIHDFKRKALRFMNINELLKESTLNEFGVRVPFGIKQAMQLDEENGNALWFDSIKKELACLNEHSVFRMLDEWEEAPEGHQCVPHHIVFDVKHDLIFYFYLFFTSFNLKKP